nr:putative UDP-glucuronate:xylan alpha-glucuronosyltransferase 5 [Coffea arabica]
MEYEQAREEEKEQNATANISEHQTRRETTRDNDVCLFTDAVISAKMIRTGQGIVARKWNGMIMKAKVIVNQYKGEPSTEEALAIWNAMLMAKQVKFQPVAQNIKWSDLFPVWINEEYPELQTCPEIPMPQFEEFQDLNVVVATVPCPGMATKLGFIDIFRLQVNLVVANLLVKSNKSIVDFSGDVYAVFLGSCGPMDEIFRCEDLLWHDNDIWVYKPDLRKLKQKMRMPVGTCQLARPIEEAAQVGWNKNASNSILQQPREAYVTVLHSSEDYLCGAIVLGQSIINSKSKKDMILLADSSISSESSKALRHAGWKIKRIERIKSPNAGKNAYNKYNYSKLRIWLLTEYDKVMFIDSDMLVFQNLDEFFLYPQLSAAENNRHIFNSGVMLIEPSRCTFETMMEKRFTIVSYNGGDQGFLNEIFRWWHRWPNKANFLKDFSNIDCGPDHLYPKNTHAMHYLGVKPWMCYRDYDCNWDIEDNQRFASDSAHAKWWQVFDSMPNKLKPVCVLTPDMEERAVIFRRIAKDGNYSDGHWKIKVKDPRRKMNDIP